MRLATSLAALALALGLGAARAADTYTPDPGHTTVRASWNHVGFSEQSLNFRGVTGTVELDPANLAATKVNITVPLASLDTGVPALNQHLSSADFFDVTKNAMATFVSTAVEQTGEKTVKVTGDLTIKGTAVPVTLDVTINAIGPHPVGQFLDYYKGKWVGVTATATVKRSDWGLSMMVPAVSDEVKLFISTELKGPAS